MDLKPDSVFYADVIPQKTNFEIITFEELYNRHKNQYDDLFKCHRIHFNALLIITSGEGRHNVDCKNYVLQPGIIIPLVKEQVHSFEKERKVNGVIITFIDEFVTKSTGEQNLFYFLQLYHSPILQISPDHLSIIQPFIDLLFREQQNSNSYLKEDLLKSIFFALLIQLTRLTPLEHSFTNNQRFLDFIRFKQLIASDFTKTHNVKDYARKMRVSYNYLNEICKEMTTKTAKTFIDDWVLLEIKRNLAEKKYSVKEIAFNTGFEEPTNLIRFFKKHTGTTPKNYIPGTL